MKTYILQETDTREIIAAITLKNGQKKTSLINRPLVKTLKQAVSEHYDVTIKSISPDENSKEWELKIKVLTIDEFLDEEITRVFELIPAANYQVNN